jgi:hypothetical protein
MIVWNPISGRFERQDAPRDQTPARPYVRDRAVAQIVWNRPWGDKQMVAAAPPALDLAHLVSFADIEEMVVYWLNHPVTSYAWFIDATTTLYTPSWSDIFNFTALARFAQQRAQMYFSRLRLLVGRGYLSYTAIAAEATHFVNMLNISEFNLRGGHPSTNRAIGRHLDPRFDLGFTIDPVSLIGRLFARLMGTVAFSSETSLAMSHFPSRLSIVAGTNAVRASTETTVVGTTQGGNPVRGVPTTPAWNPLRRHFFLIPFAEVGTLITLVIYWFLLSYLWGKFNHLL